MFGAGSECSKQMVELLLETVETCLQGWAGEPQVLGHIAGGISIGVIRIDRPSLFVGI